MKLTGQISYSYPNPQLSDPYSHLHIRSQQLLRHLIDHQCLKSFRIFTVTTTFSICNPFYMYWTPLTHFTLRWSTPSWRVVLDILFYLIVQWDGGIYLPLPIHPRYRCQWGHVLGNARSHSPVFDGFAPAHNWGVLPHPTTMTGLPLPTIWARRIQTVPGISLQQGQTHAGIASFITLAMTTPMVFFADPSNTQAPALSPAAPLISSYLQILHLIVLYISSLPHTVSETYRCAFRLRLLRENLYHHYGHGSAALLGAPALIGAPGYSSHRLGLSYTLRDRRGGSSNHTPVGLQRFPSFASTFSPTGIPWKLNLETSVLLRLTRSLSPTLLNLHCTTDPTTNIDLAFCTTIIPVPHSMEFFPLLLLAFQLVEEGPLHHRFL